MIQSIKLTTQLLLGYMYHGFNRKLILIHWLLTRLLPSIGPLKKIICTVHENHLSDISYFDIFRCRGLMSKCEYQLNSYIRIIESQWIKINFLLNPWYMYPNEEVFDIQL